MSTLAHHGMIYVPLGYKTVFSQLTDLSEAHGGSPWGVSSLLYSSSMLLFDHFPFFSVESVPILIGSVDRLALWLITMAHANLRRSNSRSRGSRARPSTVMFRACRSGDRMVRNGDARFCVQNQTVCKTSAVQHSFIDAEFDLQASSNYSGM